MERMANYSWGYAGGMFGILLIYVVIIGILLAAVVILEKRKKEKDEKPAEQALKQMGE